MKKYNIFFFILTAILQNSCQKETITTDIDPSFEQYLIEKKIDTDGIVNGRVSEKDLLGIRELYIYNFFEIKKLKLTSLAGVEKMKNLISLTISSYGSTDGSFKNIKSLDFSKNANLNHLEITSDFNNLNSLICPVSLQTLNVYNMDKSFNINLDQLSELNSLDYNFDINPTLNLTNNIKISSLRLKTNSNSDIILNLPQNNNISDLTLSYFNYLNFNLDFKRIEKLTSLSLNNSSIFLSKIVELPNLKSLSLSFDSKTEIVIPEKNSITTFKFSNNNGVTKNLDISKLKNLEVLEINSSVLNKIDLSKNLRITKLEIKYNTNPITVCLAKNQVIQNMDIDSNVTIKVCE